MVRGRLKIVPRSDKFVMEFVAWIVGLHYNSGLTGAGWSSLAARRAHNPKVVGSNPTPATNSGSLLLRLVRQAP